MIRITNLSKSYGEKKVLNNLDLEVPYGESVLVVGPSGAGKTTLLRLIAGLDIPDSGSIYINGILASSPEDLIPPFARNIGFVFQEPALWPHMTVRQNIEFVKRGARDGRVEDTEALLREVKLTGLENSYPHELSMGEAKRVALVRALAAKPTYLLMDEPLANLDFELKSELLDFIKSSVDGLTASLIYVTHDSDEADVLECSTFILKGGKLKPL